MDEKILYKKGRWMSKLLRHKPENLKLDKNGWVTVESLLDKLEIAKEGLDHIVETNSKKRFEYNTEGDMIRACQGHTMDVDLDKKPLTPPDVLYHGTSEDVVGLIRKIGIAKMTRDFVHLSTNLETASNVGSRHGKVTILTIDAKQMHKAGYKFYCSTNGVWLTNHVPTRYIK